MTPPLVFLILLVWEFARHPQYLLPATGTVTVLPALLVTWNCQSPRARAPFKVQRANKAMSDLCILIDLSVANERSEWSMVTRTWISRQSHGQQSECRYCDTKRGTATEGEWGTYVMSVLMVGWGDKKEAGIGLYLTRKNWGRFSNRMMPAKLVRVELWELALACSHLQDRPVLIRHEKWTASMKEAHSNATLARILSYRCRIVNCYHRGLTTKNGCSRGGGTLSFNKNRTI